MARESNGPICMRVSPEERSLLETVCAAQGQSLSAFARSAVIDVARRLIEEDGPAEIMKRVEESHREAAARHLAQLEEMKAALHLVGPRTGTTGN